VLALHVLRRSTRRKALANEDNVLTVRPALRIALDDIENIEAQRKALLDVLLLSDLSNLCLDYVPDLFCHLETPLSSITTSTDQTKPHMHSVPRFSFSCLSSL
jgi:hypothetical protein